MIFTLATIHSPEMMLHIPITSGGVITPAGPENAQGIISSAYLKDPTDPQWGQSLKRALGQRRVDLAIDNVAGTLLPEVIATLDYGGKVSLVGRLAGPVPQFNTGTLFFRRLRMGGVAVSTYTNAESRTAWQTLVALLAKTNAKPIVDSVLPFEQLPKAFERLAAGPMGKVLITT